MAVAGVKKPANPLTRRANFWLRGPTTTYTELW